MAEAILFTISAEILKKLASITLQQIDLAAGVKKELKKLEETLSTVKAVLLDAEQKQSTSHQLRLWLERLQDVLYDFDNVLDEFAYKAILQRLASRGNSKAKVRNISTRVKFRFRMGYKIKEIRGRLDQISCDRVQFHLTEGVIDWHVMPREMTHSFVDPSDVIGRVIDTNNILGLLTCTSKIDINLSIVPIVGIGGLGKTTIAKLVYSIMEESECFELSMWVCVSDDFDKKKMIKDIYEAATNGVDCSSLSIDFLQTRLRNTLKDKKFLLVLDDVWNEHPQKWIELRQLLINGASGSKIIVTTRSLRVASIMGTTEPYVLGGLSNEDCWTLFAKCAFRVGEEKNYPNLEIIGKQIIEKCKGVPLAVKSLGSMLFMKTDERDWLSIKKSEIWKLEDNINGILPALRLSYNQLPSSLKQCFTFCSIFPKDFEFYSSWLIEMWMSQGLIQSYIENEDLEELGLRYIKELSSRCFFQDISDYGHSMKFKMHDLVHDLALLVAQNECYIINNLPMPSKISDKVRHVSLCIKEDVPASFEVDLSNLRTLYYFPNFRREGANESFVRTCVPRFKFLRMLDMRFSSFEVLSGSIGSLNHLRYLNISNNVVMKKLPDAICKLLHLQTLNLLGCTELEGLPTDIGNLVNLRRLWITANKIYLVPNKEIGLLTSLRDLYIWQCDNLITSMECMDCLPSLRTLSLWSCKNLESWPGIMKQLPALETLSIESCGQLNLMDWTNDVHFTSLRHLEFSGLPQLKVLPGWTKGCSNTLHSLDISYCSNLTCLPNWMQNLTTLQKLVIKECERCKRGGNFWHKISRIPNLSIDWEEITTTDDDKDGEKTTSDDDDGPML